MPILLANTDLNCGYLLGHAHAGEDKIFGKYAPPTSLDEDCFDFLKVRGYPIGGLLAMAVGERWNQARETMQLTDRFKRVYKMHAPKAYHYVEEKRRLLRDELREIEELGQSASPVHFTPSRKKIRILKRQEYLWTENMQQEEIRKIKKRRNYALPGDVHAFIRECLCMVSGGGRPRELLAPAHHLIAFIGANQEHIRPGALAHYQSLLQIPDRITSPLPPLDVEPAEAMQFLEMPENQDNDQDDPDLNMPPGFEEV